MSGLKALGTVALCDGCEEEFGDDMQPNTEAFEVLDMLLCDLCADEVLADHGQFGIGA